MTPVPFDAPAAAAVVDSLATLELKAPLAGPALAGEKRLKRKGREGQGMTRTVGANRREIMDVLRRQM